MIPDPDTPQGRAEIEKRTEKRRKEAAEVRKSAEESLSDEEYGKFTNPNDIDRHKDRKADD